MLQVLTESEPGNTSDPKNKLIKLLQRVGAACRGTDASHCVELATRLRVFVVTAAEKLCNPAIALTSVGYGRHRRWWLASKKTITSC